MNTFWLEYIIWIIVAVLAIAIAFLILFLKTLRDYNNLKESQRLAYRKKSEQLLINYIYSEKNGLDFSKNQLEIIRKFKKDVLNKQKRNIITAIFINLIQEVSGELILSMHDLYQEIGLFHYSEKKLKSKKWNVIALGIRDLRQFKVRKAEKIIDKFINHPRKEVRSEAHLYFIQVFELKGLEKLKALKLPLSEWDQIQLLNELKLFDSLKVPDISSWLRLENDYLVIFILNVIKILNRIDTTDELLNLLDHPNSTIRIKAIELLGLFEVIEAKIILKEKFNALSNKEKIAFLNLIQETATKEDVSFVINFVNHEMFEIKFKALKILKTLDQKEYNLLSNESKDITSNKIIHFLNSNYEL
ncbi:hypothetical protein BTO04_14545 [Polaribacter sp. SA4-10]|uniref:hypothetical protein n=1 Tax=Polaribacter sp. SA4-10 TaxID=754397 RepID=UPI000B3CDCEA|nr:hypothetical protein [Polaribacter sp. SA4-10]ARV07841.1 hypothetical protein BTO04_14545 [Polaribacter sp. SA4-10]